MKALAEGASEDVRYLRVMLIGPSGVGKTSLLDRMMGNEPSSKASSTKMAVTHNLWARAKHDARHWEEVSEEDKILEIAKLLQKAKIDDENNTSPSIGSGVSPSTENQGGDLAPLNPEGTNSDPIAISTRESRPLSTHHDVSSVPDDLSIPKASSQEHKIPSGGIRESPTKAIMPKDTNTYFEKKIKSINDEFTKCVLMKAYKMIDQVGDEEEEIETYLHVWDCGGQPVYLNALPPFLSAVTAFLIVFNVTKDLNDKVELIWNDKGKQLKHAKLSISYTDLITQWMAAIDSYVPRELKMFEKVPKPRVIMVGTNSKDAYQKQDREKFTSYFECTFRDTAYLDLIERDTTVVENKQNIGDFSEIHKFVMDVANDFKMKTPIKWVLFRKILSSVADSEPIVSLNTCISIGKVCNIKEKEVLSVLDFYHELGVFLFYHKEDIVIASPKWLVEKMGCLLCHQKQLQKQSRRRNAVTLFCQYGILVNDLYQDVFKNHKDMQNINLIDILTKFSLATGITINLSGSTYNGKKGYFIPTMLSQSQIESKEIKCHLSTGPLCLHVPSRNYLPPGFYVQLLVAVTKREHFVLDSSTAGYNTICFNYKKHFIVNVSTISNTHVEITLYRNGVRNKGMSYFSNICQDVLKAIISATKELPLNKLLEGFDVQPALLCNTYFPGKPQFLDIKQNQVLEDYEECDVTLKAKMWLSYNSNYKVCFTDRVFCLFVCLFVFCLFFILLLSFVSVSRIYFH